MPTQLLTGPKEKAEEKPRRAKSTVEARQKPIPKSRTSIGPYLQTTTRQLTGDPSEDQNGTEKSPTTFRVLFPFKARSDRELTVNKDEIVSIISVVDEKWVECEVKSKRGLLPDRVIKFFL